MVIRMMKPKKDDNVVDADFEEVKEEKPKRVKKKKIKKKALKT